MFVAILRIPLSFVLHEKGLEKGSDIQQNNNSNNSIFFFSFYFRHYKRSVVVSREVRIFIVPTRAARSCDENPLW